MIGHMGFVDLHSHVLPALDDGATDLSESDTMLRGLISMGYDIVCATPHQKANQFLPEISDIRAAHAATRARHPKIDLRLAAENYWDDVFFSRIPDLGFPRYDDKTAFLFEIPPPAVPVAMTETLFRLASRGLLPVMAHPERYTPYWDDLDALADLGQRTALVVDLGAISGHHGWRVGRMARRLVKERLAHAAASDVHTPGDLRAAGEGIAWIKKKLGPEAVTRLLDENPRRILAGELPDP
jgi:protein-tyrosine phosphatase